MNEQEEEKKKAADETLENNPVMPFTLEEVFKIMDFIVRIEDFTAKRVIFIKKKL